MQKYNFRQNSVILQGDTHNTSIIHDTISLRIPEGWDYIQIGDGGWGFGNPSYAIDNAKSWLDKINKLCQKVNVNCYLVRGNHDNPVVWSIPTVYSNVILVQDGDIGVFPNGKKVLLVGGGVSVDRYSRKEGIDYWKDEITSDFEIPEECDFMFSHDCPSLFNHDTDSLVKSFGWYVERDPTLLDECRLQREKLDSIVLQSKVKKILYGHYHNNITQTINDVYGRCVDINELYEFKADD